MVAMEPDGLLIYINITSVSFHHLSTIPPRQLPCHPYSAWTCGIACVQCMQSSKTLCLFIEDQESNAKTTKDTGGNKQESLECWSPIGKEITSAFRSNICLGSNQKQLLKKKKKKKGWSMPNQEDYYST